MQDSSQVLLTVTRALGLVGDVEVEYATSPGTALSNEDFVQQTGRVTFAAGQQSRPIIVRILKVNRELASWPRNLYQHSH